GTLNGGSPLPATAGTQLADRIFFDIGSCVQFQNRLAPCNRSNALSCTTDPVAGALYSGYENFAYGTDIWKPYKDCTVNPPKSDPLHLCDKTQSPGFVPFEPITQPRVYTPDLSSPRS